MKFTLATCVRNEGPYLLEWVAHYKLLGFDRIVIFSNDNDDGSDALLTALKRNKLIEWYPRTLPAGASPQTTAFKSYSRKLLANPNEQGGYLTWIDCDEFLILKQHATIQELLSQYDFPDSLYINWKHFGSSGLENYSTEPTIARFMNGDSQTSHNRQCKCINKIDSSLYTRITNHRPIPRTSEHWGRVIYAASLEKGEPVAKPFVYGSNLKKNENSPIFHEVCQLNHYAVRSREEYAWKIARGNGYKPLDAEKAHFSKTYFTDHDLNSEYESLAADKYAQAIQNYIATLPKNLIKLNEKIIKDIVMNNRSKMATPTTMPVQKNQSKPTQDAPPASNSKAYSYLNWLPPERIQQAIRGYSDENLRKRLAYGSFVSDQLNYVFVETPKAACSTLKWVLADIEQREVKPRQHGHESVASMIIHDRTSHNIKNLWQINADTRKRLFTEPSVLRFCVVRNPYSRLVSAWADKIRQKEPNFRKSWKIIAAHFGTDPESCPSFSQFARWIVETQRPEKCNPHWRPMADLLLPDLMEYTHILHTECLATELQAVLDIISQDSNATALLNKHQINESLPVNWRSCYDEETANLVASFYKEDFERYGYDVNSWQTSDLNEAHDLTRLKQDYDKLEQAALKAIRARNEIIYELLKKESSKLPPLTIKPQQKTKVLVLGDSHVQVFSHPKWQKTTYDLELKVISVDGATVSGLENPNSKTQAGAHFQQALSENTADVILLCLGEVDVGFVIWYKSEKKEITVEEATQRAINNYCHLIELAASKAHTIVLSTPLPTINDDNPAGAVAKARSEIKASQKQRTELTCHFNNVIAEWCRNKNIMHINLDSVCLSDNGLVDTALLHTNPKNHHYHPKTYRKLLFKHVLPAIQGLHSPNG